MSRARIIGSYLSPYVRKVLVVLHFKGIAYEIDPIVPFFGDDRFSRLSPIRRIPVFLDDRVTLRAGRGRPRLSAGFLLSTPSSD
jgi:glutathione S-transferase